MISLLQIGRLPEDAGIGGVTLHVSRLMYHLKQKGVCTVLCDYKRTSIFMQLKNIFRFRIIHIHISHPVLRFIYVLIAVILRKNVVLTIHGNLERFGVIYNILDKGAVMLSSVPIMLNDSSYSKALRYNSNAVLMSAFLPPKPDECEINNIHLELFRMLRKQYRKIYITNAYRCVFDDEKNEIYGISFLIKNFENLNDCCLIVSDPSGENTQRYAQNAPDNIRFIDAPHSFFSLIKFSDGIIRATSTDGDSLTIREGIYCGVPIIATGCVDRPDGCVLFNYGDSESFYKALEQIKDPHLMDSVEGKNVNPVDKYKNIYQKLADRL